MELPHQPIDHVPALSIEGPKGVGKTATALCLPGLADPDVLVDARR
ncbi:MAG: hypothetical protein ACT4NY_27775 [Pseudonocardiales bacterium]